jgi:oligogalacturonide lyase
MRAGWSRRAFVCSLPLLIDGAGAAEAVVRFHDPATEFDVLRLTDPASSSFLPGAHLHSSSSRGNSLVFSSDKNGTLDAYRIDIKNGETHQLTNARNLDPKSLSLMPDEHAICYFDGPKLRLTGIGNQRKRDVYECPDGWARTSGFGLSDDGNHSAFVEKGAQKYRIQLANMLRGAASTVTESDAPISDVMPRPRRAGILYRKNGALWLVNFDGQQNRMLKTAPSGEIGPFLWSLDGKSVFYLSYPQDSSKLHQIRECIPDTNEDKLIAPTSQFVNFTRNVDSSVFIGVSANKASPHILILLRLTKRELTMCEHRATNPSEVVVVFSPSSQRLYFQTDKEGKPAIYTMVVDRFVERTES